MSRYTYTFPITVHPPANPLDGYAPNIEAGIESAIQESANINMSGFDVAAGIALVPGAIHEDSSVAAISSRVFNAKVSATRNMRQLRNSLIPARTESKRLRELIELQTNIVVGSISAIISAVRVASEYSEAAEYPDWQKWELSYVMERATRSTRSVGRGTMASVLSSVNTINSSITAAATAVENAQEHFDAVLLNASRGPDRIYIIKNALYKLESTLSTVNNHIATAQSLAGGVLSNIQRVISLIDDDIAIVDEMYDLVKLATLSITYEKLPRDVQIVIDGLMR